MALIRLPQQYATNRQAQAVRDAMMMIGEEAILLVMYHPAVDEGKQPRCHRCYDADYAENADYMCQVCYGTTFEGGIKRMGRVWTIISDNTNAQELLQRFGEFEDDERLVQFEALTEVHQHDFVARVQQWTRDHRVAALGPLMSIDSVPSPHSLRTGNRFGNGPFDDYGVSTKASIVHKLHPLHSLNLIGTPIPRVEPQVYTP